LERDGGYGLYPPPTFHAALLTYLIHVVQQPDEAKPDVSADLVSHLLSSLTNDVVKISLEEFE
jgi:hypothetical protein